MRNVSPSLNRCLAGAVLFGTMAGADLLWTSDTARAQTLKSATIAGQLSLPLAAVPQGVAVKGSDEPKMPSRVPVDPLTYQAMKSQASMPRAAVQGKGWNSQPPTSMPAAQSNLQAQTVNPPEATFFGISTVSCAAVNGNLVFSPSDMALAVGDTTVGVLQAVNDCISVFDKTTGAQQAGFPKAIPSFFALPASHPNTADPRLLFDWINHRYLFVVISFPNGCGNGCPSAAFYNLAVSVSDNPAGAYCLFTFPTVVGQSGTGSTSFPLPDFPRLGQSRDAVFLVGNDFRGGGFIGEEVIALPKGLGGTSGNAGLYSACGTAFGYTTVVIINNGFTMQPATNFSPYDDPKSMYFVSSDFGTSNQLVLTSFHDPFNIDGAISFTQVRINVANTYSLPPGASQCSTGTKIDTGDTRISGTAMYAAGSIYAALSTGISNGTAGIISYQIQPFVTTGGGATDGQITGGRVLNEIVRANSGGGSTSSWYYPVQQPDPEGNITTVFGFSTATTCPSVVYLSRRAAQAVNTDPDDGVFAAIGAGPNTSGRWGDYNATAPAGMVSGGGTGGFPKMWFAGMVGASTGGLNWNTVIGRTGYNAINQNIPNQTSSR